MDRKSIWTDKSDLPSFGKIKNDADTDILIIGGGLCGVLCAYTLESVGADYILLEAERICSNTTANTTAKITSQHGLIYEKLAREQNDEYARLYYEANEEAVRRLSELCRDIDCDYESADSYIYSLTDNGNLEREVRTLERLGIPVEYTKSTELPFPVTGALKFENQAHFNPLKFISHIARGLNIYENSRVTEMQGTTAIVNGKKVRAKRVIVATHFPFINKHGFYFLKEYQSRSYVVALKGARHISGMYLDEQEGGLSFRSYGDYLLLGGGGHRTGKGSCAFSTLEEAAKKYYPGASIKYEWATQDCITLDGVPYIGRYSRLSDNLFVATGFNKWGMTSSMVAATLLCDMMLGKQNEYEKIFSPRRSIFRPQLAKNTVEALRGWLTFGKRRCPHLGCAMTFNKYERSWDCSCHGSRFGERGELLDGPANGDVKL